jgi:DNA-binding response OmpR family regulator
MRKVACKYEKRNEESGIMKNRILVIDDDELYREGICMELDLEGYEVIAASNGKKGFELAKNKLPDLIISDVNMPEMDGYETIRLLSTDNRTSTIPIIMMTGLTTNYERPRHGINAGVVDNIVKPFTRNDLLKIISSKLQK